MPRQYSKMPRRQSICPNCHKPFAPTENRTRQIYCTSKCFHVFRRKSPEVRFWKYVNKTDGCWLWTGNKHTDGYGRFTRSHHDSVPAHRYSWMIHYGDIPSGMQICHRCDTPPCVNPSHLFLGTPKDNYDDMVNKGRQKSGPFILTREQAVYIKSIPRTYGAISRIARELSVTRGVVYRVINGKTWKNA